MLLITAARANRPEIVAHRGASHDAPENTLASIQLAWDLDADAAELDVHLSSDGRIVVMHDKDLKRTAGSPALVAESDWAAIGQLDAGSWKGERWAGEPVPLLDQILPTIPEGKRLFVEIKCGPEIVPPLVGLIRESGKVPEQVAIISFNYDVCVAAKKALPAHRVYLLSGFKTDEATGIQKPSFDELIAKAKAGGLDGLDVSFRGPITAENVAKAKQEGLALLVYTVNELEDAKRLVQAGVDGITTDRPDYLMDEALQEKRAPRIAAPAQ